MTILKDLLALKQSQPTAITEARGSKHDMDELMDNWMDANKAYSWEGQRGVRNLEKLVHELDSHYSSLDSFFYDNSGAIEAVLEWIKGANVPEWANTLAENYKSGDDDGGDDDDDNN